MKQLCGIDVETGGLSPVDSPLLSIGAWTTAAPDPVTGNSFHRYVLPEPGWGAVSVAAARVSGYPQRWQHAIPLQIAMREFADWIKRYERAGISLQPVAHNAGFDRGFLEEASRRTRVRLGLDYHWRCSAAAAHLVLDQLALNGETERAFCEQQSVKLEVLTPLAGHWSDADIEQRQGRHDARDDARAAVAVWEWILSCKAGETLLKMARMAEVA